MEGSFVCKAREEMSLLLNVPFFPFPFSLAPVMLDNAYSIDGVRGVRIGIFITACKQLG